jgi:hypothetical protein
VSGLTVFGYALQVDIARHMGQSLNVIHLVEAFEDDVSVTTGRQALLLLGCLLLFEPHANQQRAAQQHGHGEYII